MKKIILIVVFCMMLSSCDFMKVHMDGWANPVHSTDEKIDVTLYEYDGHTYLIFGHTLLTSGVVHDPNCNCSKKEEQI